MLLSRRDVQEGRYVFREGCHGGQWSVWYPHPSLQAHPCSAHIVNDLRNQQQHHAQIELIRTHQHCFTLFMVALAGCPAALQNKTKALCSYIHLGTLTSYIVHIV